MAHDLVLSSGARVAAPSVVRMAGLLSRAVELIGYPTTSSSVFEHEAVTEGVSSYEALTGLGRALTD